MEAFQICRPAYRHARALRLRSENEKERAKRAKRSSSGSKADARGGALSSAEQLLLETWDPESAALLAGCEEHLLPPSKHTPVFHDMPPRFYLAFWTHSLYGVC